MGASVGCEPTCNTDEVLVSRSRGSVNKATQAPSRHSEDSPRQELDSQLDLETEEQEARKVEKELLGSSYDGSRLALQSATTSEQSPSTTQRLMQTEQAFREAGTSTSSQTNKVQSVEEGPSHPATLDTHGEQESQSQALVCGNSLPDDSLAHLGSPMGSPMGTMELPKDHSVGIIESSPLQPEEASNPLVVGGVAERKDSSNPSFHTIEKEPSNLSGGTILPEEDAEAKKSVGPVPADSIPSQTAFSFAAARTPSEDLSRSAASVSPAAAAAAAPSGMRSMLMAAPEAALAPLGASGAGQNPQEGPPHKTGAAGAGARASSAARRQAAENRLAQLATQGDSGALADAKMKVREWQWQLKMEIKSIEREIKKVKTDEAKLHKQMQAEGQKGNVDYVRQLARTIIRSRQAVRRLEATKVSMNDINLQLTTCAAAMSMKHAVRVSGGVLQGINGVSSLEDLEQAVEQLHMERQRGAEMEEVVGEAFYDEEEDAEVDREVQRLVEEYELDRMGLLAGMGAPRQRQAPSSTGSQAPARRAPPPHLGSGV